MNQLRAGALALVFWLLMSGLSPVAAVNIVFDYSYDSNGFFTPDRRVLLERAAAEFTSRMTSNTWVQVNPAIAGGHYELAVVNPSTLGVSWVTNAIIPTNQITVHVGAIDFTKAPFSLMTNSSGDGATQLLGIRNVTGAMTSVLTHPTLFRPVDASITFDLQGIRGFGGTISAQWFFIATNADLNIDSQPTAPPDDYYADFYCAAVHELGHVLGIHNPTNFQALLASDPNFCVAWMRQVQSDGHGGYVFTGPHARQCYYGHIGTNIPLEPTTLCHWADGVRSTPTNNWTSVTHEDNEPFRVEFSELEFGALQDLGYVITPVPNASITSITTSNRNLNLRLERLIPYLQCYVAASSNLTAGVGWANMQLLVPTGTVTTVTGTVPPNLNQFFLKLRR